MTTEQQANAFAIFTALVNCMTIKRLRMFSLRLTVGNSRDTGH